MSDAAPWLDEGTRWPEATLPESTRYFRERYWQAREHEVKLHGIVKDYLEAKKAAVEQMNPLLEGVAETALRKAFGL